MPDALDAVAREDRVARDDGKVLRSGLYSNEPIEWILVLERQIGHAGRMVERNWQQRKAVHLQLLLKEAMERPLGTSSLPKLALIPISQQLAILSTQRPTAIVARALFDSVASSATPPEERLACRATS